jgi:hypothetical protein
MYAESNFIERSPFKACLAVPDAYPEHTGQG